MRVEFAPVTLAHAAVLARTMRPADAAECAALGQRPLEAVVLSWVHSTWCSALLVDGEVAAIAGLSLEASPVLAPRRALVWLLTAHVVEAAPYALHWAAKSWLRQARRHADVLWNWVDARYEATLRWVRALGFVVHPPFPRGPDGHLFHLVTLETSP